MGMLDGKCEVPMALSSSMRCSNTLWSKGGKRWNI